MTVRKAHLLISLLVIALLVPASAGAVNRTFTGPTGGDWNTPGNWTGGVVPGPGDTATITGKTVTVNASPAVRPDSVQVNSSTISVASGATLTAGISMNLAGFVNLRGPGAIDFGSGATLSITAVVLDLSVGVDLTLPAGPGASATWVSGGINMQNDAAITSIVVPAGATFSLFDGGHLNAASATDTARIVNNGTITKNGPGTTNLRARFVNAGTVDVAAGLLAIFLGPPAGQSHTGQFAAAQGSILQLLGGAHHLDSGASFEGAGVAYSGGTIAAGVAIPVEGLTFQGRIDFGAASSLAVSDFLIVSAGPGSQWSGAGSIDFAPGSTLTISAILTLFLGFDLTLPPGDGTTWSSSAINLEGAAAITSLVVPVGATFPLLDGGAITSSTAGDTARIVNNGTIVKSGLGTAFINSQFFNSGLLDVQAGTLGASSGTFPLTQDSGETAIGTGATLGASVTLNGGTLSGRGTVTHVTNNAGTVAPGAAGERGSLAIAGTYTQAAGGTLEVDINGNALGSGGTTGYDRLAVGGVASLAGTLAIVDDPGFGPQPADVFTVLTRASGSGTFVLSNADYAASYTATAVNLSFVGAPNEAPDAVDDAATVDEDSSGNSITVLANDTDPDGDTLRVTGATVPANGTVFVFADGSGLAYTPNPSFSGADSFDYTISDGNGGTDTATVTITVRPASTATVTLVKDLVPSDDPGRFVLRIDRSNGDFVDFAWDAGDGGTLGPVTVLAGPSSNSYRIFEQAMVGTSLADYASSWACVEDPAGGTNPDSPVTDPDADGLLTVAPDDAWTCTITNTRLLATITVVKDLIPADDPGRFSLLLSEPGGVLLGSVFTVGDGGSLGPVAVLADPLSNSYRIREAAESPHRSADYASSWACVEDPAGGANPASPVTDPDADGLLTVAPGDAWTCTITNTRLATITLIKQLIPSDDPGRFELKITVPAGALTATVASLSGAGDGGTLGPVTVSAEPGNEYTVREDMLPHIQLDQYGRSLVCVEDPAGGTNAASPVANADDGSAVLVVAPGDAWTCTITNTRLLATITVVKDLIPADDPGRFSLLLSEPGGVLLGSVFTVGDGGSLGPVAVLADPLSNSYRIREAAESPHRSADYASSWVCVEDPAGGANPASPVTDPDADGLLTVAPGDAWTCTITNTRLATITLIKQLIPSDDPGRFELKITVPAGALTATVASLSGAGDGGTLGPVTVSAEPGNEYTVGEDMLPHVQLEQYMRSLVCVEDPAGGTNAASPVANADDGSAVLVVAPGDDWTCTITNVRLLNGDPSAGDDAATVDEGSSGNPIAVLANDTDPDGDTLAITANSDPAHGTATCTASSCTYTSDAGYRGPDSFTYTISDGNGGTATATVSVQVRGAAEQIVVLIDKTIAFLDLPRLRPVFRAPLEVAARALARNNRAAACVALNLYRAAVRVAPARAFTAAERAELIADVNRIRNVIGCR